MDKDKKILLWLIAGSRGGVNRALILKYIISSPSNANRISLATGIEYKTVQHHLGRKMVFYLQSGINTERHIFLQNYLIKILIALMRFVKIWG
jgi:DNA-binding transcriptional ArsR family regulator